MVMVIWSIASVSIIHKLEEWMQEIMQRLPVWGLKLEIILLTEAVGWFEVEGEPIGKELLTCPGCDVLSKATKFWYWFWDKIKLDPT